MDPLVSVVIPVCSSEKFIEETVTSILNQSYGNFELIIVNDSSKDKTIDIITRMNDSRIKIFDNLSKGATEAYNTGFKNAKGKYISICDHDDISEFDRIKKQVEFLENNPAVDVLGNQINVVNENNKFLYKISPPQNHKEIVRNLQKWGEGVNNPTLLVRKSIFERFGYYNESYFPVADYEFYLRNSDNLIFHNLSDTLLSWRSLPTSISHKNSKLFNSRLFFISRKFLYSKYYNTNKSEFYELMAFRAYYTNHLLKSIYYSLSCFFYKRINKGTIKIFINSAIFFLFVKFIRKYRIIENPDFLKFKDKILMRLSFSNIK